MNTKVYYFIGIGGIGMSAIARYLKNNGHSVYGYDRTRTQLCIQLEEEGMNITYEDNPAHLPENIEMVIYTPAIPSDNNILQTVLQKGLKIEKRARARRRFERALIIDMALGRRRIFLKRRIPGDAPKGPTRSKQRHIS
jgi:UDP-N-acetylmuramate-alanine ligase